MEEEFGDLHAYDSLALKWSEITDVNGTGPTPRADHRMCRGGDGRLYVHGGFSQIGGFFDDLHAFDVGLSKWERVEPVDGLHPSARASHGFASFGRSLVVHTGYTVGLVIFSDLHVFDTVDKKWTEMTPDVVGGTWPSPRTDHAFVSDERGLFYLFGGWNRGISMGDFFVLDLASTPPFWRELTHLTSGQTPLPQSKMLSVFAGGCLLILSENDKNLYMFSPDSMTWMGIINEVAGTFSPFLGSLYALAALGSRLYVQGGFLPGCNFMALSYPKGFSWTRGLVDLVDIFEWDTLAVQGGVLTRLEVQMKLCSDFLPCSLNLVGQGPNAVVMRVGNGSILCSSTSGCTSVKVSLVKIECQEGPSTSTIIQAQGTIFVLTNVSFIGCSSLGDGSALQALDGAVGHVRFSEFSEGHSHSRGGAIALVRSQVFISNSHFRNTSSELGGGCVWAGALQGNFDLVNTSNTLHIVDTVFHGCGSRGPGGAILASLGNGELFGWHSIRTVVGQSRFEACSSGADGGAVSVNGPSVTFEIRHSYFTKCWASTSGGSASVSDRAELGILGSVFTGNGALGVGGGALRIVQGGLFVFDSEFTGNSALRGGGGVMWWSESVFPAGLATLCPAGTTQVEVSCGENLAAGANCSWSSCVPCAPGSWKGLQGGGDCLNCSAGSFSAEFASTSCVMCRSGTFSNRSGASQSSFCTACEAGWYTGLEGASMCSDCPGGSYSEKMYSTTCLSCAAGSYSMATAATTEDTCAQCEAGTFSSGPKASLCGTCLSGTYSTADGSTECTSCPAGSYSNPGAVLSSCLLCSPGFVVVSSGSDACLPCGAGTFVETEGQSECAVCYPGSFSTSVGANDSSFCNLCGEGTFSATTNGASSCLMCDSGSYVTSRGATTCYDCPPGEYLNLTGPIQDTICFICSSGSFSSQRGASFCDACYPGTFSPQSASSQCLDCATGKFSSARGSENDSCTSCDAGSFSSQNGASACDLCTLGYFSNETGSTSCMVCVAGRRAFETNHSREGSFWRYKWCEPGTFVDQLGSTECFVCPAGFYSVWDGATKCEDCSWFPSDICSSQQVGAFQNSPLTRTHLSATSNTPLEHNKCSDVENCISVEGEGTRGGSTECRDNLIEGFDAGHFSERRFTTEVFDSDSKCGVCGGADNRAVFGQCIGSSSVRINVSIEGVLGWPNRQVYVGLPFVLRVALLDSHQQAVSSDSSTLLEVQVGLGPEIDADPLLSVGGNMAFQLLRGQGAPTLSVRPPFVRSSVSVNSMRFSGAPRQEVYLAVSGLELGTFASITSIATRVGFSMDDVGVCPSGYILSFEGSEARSSSWAGGCVQCPPGKYSIDPLALPSSNSTWPSCFNCPASATCTGGDSVAFGMGRWIASHGRYVLVECPRGSQLVNSINGEFALELQSCLQCNPDEYILSSNSSKYTCQKCPVGGLCDGADLKGKVEGSLWLRDYQNGIYRLVSCPPGYELINTFSEGEFSYMNQECRTCPAAFFCLGGSAERSPCPDGMYAIPGANSSSRCEAAAYLQIVVEFSVPKQFFDSEMQLQFRQAIGFACAVQVSHVVITSISQIRRQSENEPLIRVIADVATSSLNNALSAARDLEQERLNTFLSIQGLPRGKLISSTVRNFINEHESNQKWIVIGTVTGASLLIACAILASTFLLRRNEESSEEKKLRARISALRTRLGITKEDGYILSSEKATKFWFWSVAKETIVVQRSFVEAAARLDMYLPYESSHFDAFCLCLECGDSTSRFRGETSHPFKALCDWMLEIADSLIRPSLSGNLTMDGRGCDLDSKERFEYFSKRVAKAHLWTHEGGKLFQSLKALASRFMNDVADLCNRRYEVLKSELGGEDLVNFFASPEDSQNLFPILRQDDPEVRAVVVHEEAVREASVQRLFRLPTAAGLDEDVFIAQLVLRARLVNPEFQAVVRETISQHARSGPQTRDWMADSAFMHNETLIGTDSAGVSSRPVASLDSSHFSLENLEGSNFKTSWMARQPEVTAESALRNRSVATLGFTSTPSFCSASASPDQLGSSMQLSSAYIDGRMVSSKLPVKFMCAFQGGEVAAVEVMPAPIKAAARMREKLGEYAAEGVLWPLCAKILDPVRVSVVCEGPSHMLEVAGWFLQAGMQNGGRPGPSVLPICRVKNKFALGEAELVGGYRDLMLCGVAEGAGGLRIVGEIQIHDKELFDLKLLMHKYYRIRRAKTVAVI